MSEIIIGIVLDALLDTLKVIPFLYIVYFLIEYLEHHHAEKLPNALRKLGSLGSLGGALLGSIPQCGFSAAVSNLFSGGLISMGTLISVYIATSDEAIPLLISNPSYASDVWRLIVVKIIIAVVVGFVVDLIARHYKKENESPHIDELCRDCDCEHHNIFVSALIHTAQISLIIMIINLVLGSAFEFLGTDRVASIMMKGSPVQPLITALFGFIPNCAASVIITQLYIEGVLSFGSCIAGLCTGAGVGLIVLFRTNHSIKQNLSIMGILYLSAVVSGVIINLIV